MAKKELSAADKKLYRVRTDVALDQRKVREDVKELAKKFFSDLSVPMLVKGVEIKNYESKIFVAWLSEMLESKVKSKNPPEECQRLVRWIIKNRVSAFRGFNPYLLGKVSEFGNSLVKSKLPERVKKMSSKISNAVKEWTKNTNI